jgi:hypothetical protein
MSVDYKVAVLSDTEKKTSRDRQNMPTLYNLTTDNHTHARPAAPYKVSELFIEHGYESTVFNYMMYWDQDILLDTLEKYSEGKPLLCAFSLTFNNTSQYVEFITKLVKKIKERCPGSITIIGGVRDFYNIDLLKQCGDVIYKGRSINLFMKSIHDRLFDTLIDTKFEPFVIEHPDDANLPDNPIVHKFYDHDIWESTDVAMFETTIGCKFNCTFCNYDFRNMKNPIVSTVDSLAEFFESAKNKNITHFFACDDTINETDEKINNIHAAVKEVGIDPTITAFTRQDVIAGRPHQMEILSQAGITNLVFGIESFNYNANKRVRKGVKGEKILENLALLKSIDPNFHLQGHLIFGLSGDNKESIKKYIDLSLEQRLLDCIAVINLHFRHYGEMHDMWEFQSDIEKDPAKFGYKIKIPEQNQENNFEFVWWENEWTNRDDIKEFNTEMINHIIDTYGLTAQVTGWTYNCLKALGVVSNPVNAPSEYREKVGFKLQHLLYNDPIDKAIDNYIKKKVAYIYNSDK